MVRADLPVELPTTSEELAGVIPDVPRWVEVRSLLLSGADVVAPAGATGRLVVERAHPPSMALIGAPDAALIERLAVDAPEGAELLVQPDGVAQVRELLPRWSARRALVHVLAEPVAPDDAPVPGVVVADPPDPELVLLLPPDEQDDAGGCDALAVVVRDGEAVASCQAAITDTLWDVGIDTYRERDRRRGHATAAYRALASHLAASGRQPVWCAYDDNQASLGLARKLGFTVVGEVWVLGPPASGARA